MCKAQSSQRTSVRLPEDDIASAVNRSGKIRFNIPKTEFLRRARAGIALTVRSAYVLMNGMDDLKFKTVKVHDGGDELVARIDNFEVREGFSEGRAPDLQRTAEDRHGFLISIGAAVVPSHLLAREPEHARPQNKPRQSRQQ
jgi:hypothetical protein